MGKTILQELTPASRELIAVYEMVVGLGAHAHLLLQLGLDAHVEVG